MKIKRKKFIETFIISGLTFAILMAGFEYYDDQKFTPLRFLFHFTFFGLGMSFIARSSQRKESKKKKLKKSKI